MLASPKSRKRDRLKAIFRTRLDRSVSSAPNSQAASQSTLQTSQPQENRRTNIELQGTASNLTATLDTSINTNDDNVRVETSRASAHNSLWEDALNKLETSSSTEDRSHAHALREFAQTQDLGATGQTGSAASDDNDIIEKVKHAAELKRAEAEQKAWRIEVGSRTIVLRDVATRIIDCLNKFKEVGDIAVSYDPVHAALPWAAFRFLLQAATLNEEQAGQVLAGIHAAMQAYLRANVYQDLYFGLPDRQKVIDALKISVVDLFAAICAFLGLAVKYISSGSVKNATRGLLNPKNLVRCTESIAETEAQVEKNAGSCKAILDAAAHQRQGSAYDKLVGILEAHTDRFEQIQNGLTRIEAGVGHLVEELSREEAHVILSWISEIPYESDLYNSRRARLAGTCEWLIAHETYQEWKAASVSTTLWLHGIPGAGKTKLSTKVVDDIALMDQPLAYFFCDRNQENRRDPAAVLYSITRQLSRKAGPERIHGCTVRAYNRKQERSFASDKFTDEESRDLLLELTNGNSQSTIIIDGLDECNEGSRRYILDTLDHLVQHSSSVVKVFVASRNDKDLTQHYSDSPNLEIEAAHNQGDIEKLVMERLSSSQWAAEGMSVSVRKAVGRLFREKSQGMFQWASLHIDELLEFESDQAIMDWLHRLPEGLKAAYDRIYDALGARWRIYANRAFMWLMAAGDIEISPESLCVLVCQDVSREFDYHAKLSPSSLLFACRNLIKVDEEEVYAPYEPDPQVYASYASSKSDSSRAGAAEDYYNTALDIDTPYDEYEDSFFSHGVHDNETLKTCRFAHLSVQEYLEETQRLSLAEAKRMILMISLKFWERASATDDQEEQDDGHSEANDTSTYLQLQVLTVQSILEFLRSGDMSRENQVIWDHLLQSTTGHDIIRGSPIWRALDKGTCNETDFHSAPGNYELRRLFASPLNTCALLGNQALIRYWIENGFFNPMDDLARARDLVFAAYICQQTAVCNSLIDAGTNFKDETSQMLEARLENLFQPLIPLRLDSLSALIRLLKQLFDDGAPATLCPSDRSVYDGNYPLEVAQMFCEHGANPNVYDNIRATPLMHAVRRGDANIEMTKLLLHYGADVTSLDNNEQTPLHYAAQTSQNLETLKLLLNRGVDPNIGATLKGTPLQLVAYHSSIEAVKLLLESNARVKTLSWRFGTALHAAALRGSRGKEIYDLLLKNGADPNFEFKIGGGAAFYSEEVSAERVLLKKLESEERRPK